MQPNKCLHFSNSLQNRPRIFKGIIQQEGKNTKDWVAVIICFCVCSLSVPYWSVGKSLGVCPRVEATISVWLRGYGTVVWKSRRAYVMESPVYTVFSLWLSPPQIYVLLISASPTLTESQAGRSFELPAILMFVLSIADNHTNTNTIFSLRFSKLVV